MSDDYPPPPPLRGTPTCLRGRVSYEIIYFWGDRASVWAKDFVYLHTISLLFWGESGIIKE